MSLLSLIIASGNASSLLVLNDRKLKMFHVSGSGDHDMCVPYTGSQVWMKYVRYKIVDEWRPWSSNGQVAGYLLVPFPRYFILT